MNKQQRTVLTIAYCFPPLAAVGAARMVRFVRYLPDFGWEPLVLTVDTKHVRTAAQTESDPIIEYPIDYGTLAYVSPEVHIERRRVLRPVRSLIILANKLKRSVFRQGLASSAQSPPLGVTNPSSGPIGAVRRIVKSGLDWLFLSLVFPDLQCGWFLPAIVGGLSIVRRERPAAIVSSGPPHTCHLVAAVLKKLTGLPLVLDFRDPWARTPWNRSGDSRVRRALNNHFERWCVNQADCVLLNTLELRNEFVEAYPPSATHKFAVLPNGYDPGLIDRVASLRSEKAPASNERCVRICHPGTIYGPRDLRPVISAIARLSRADCPVILDQVGFVTDPASMLRYAAELGVQDCVVLHGQVSHDDALRHMARADMFVLCQPGTSLQVPAKLFEMLPFCKPILALAESNGATAQIIERNNLGIVLSPADHDAVSQGLADLIDQNEQFNASDGWQQAMRDFNGQELVGQLSVILDSLMPPRPRDDDVVSEQVLSEERLSSHC